MVPRAPGIEASRAKQCSLAQNLERGDASYNLSQHCFRYRERKIVSHAGFKALLPICSRIWVPEFGLDPYFLSADFDWTGRHIIGPEIERAATREIEPGMVPVAGENAVLHASAIEGEPHVRAPIVKGVNATLVTDHQDRSVRPAYYEPPLCVEFREHACAHKSGAHIAPPLPVARWYYSRPRAAPGLHTHCADNRIVRLSKRAAGK
jgi:hypothetical protein